MQYDPSAHPASEKSSLNSQATERKTPITRACQAWRGILPIHPACEIIPAYNDAKLLEVGRDIKASGGIIVLVEPDGTRLIDGRSRLDAMCQVKDRVDPRTNDNEEEGIARHRAAMAALADESGSPSPEAKSPSSEPVLSDSPKSPVAPIAVCKPSAKTKVKGAALNGNTAEALAAAHRALNILHRPVSGPNNEAARQEIGRVIDLLKPPAAERARAA
jgi:hypothetical protein